jgi:hypothetical protein
MFVYDLHRFEANYYDEVDYQVDYHRFERVEKVASKAKRVSNPPPKRTWRWVF